MVRNAILIVDRWMLENGSGINAMKVTQLMDLCQVLDSDFVFRAVLKASSWVCSRAYRSIVDIPARSHSWMR